METRKRLVARLFAPVDAASLVFVRIAFGLVVLWEVARYVENGWIESYYIDPEFFFTYYGFGWVQPWHGRRMYVHFAVLAAFAAMAAAGLLYRVASAGLFLCFTYVFLLDQARYLNHFYVVSLLALLMAVVPANRWFSLDARLGLAPRSDFVPFWSVFLLRAQLSIVYFYAGIAKINPDWLRGEPMRTWLGARTGFPVIGRFFEQEWAVYLFSWGGLLFDLSIAPLLIWRRTRPYAFVGALVFHLLNARLFQIGIFPWLMMAVSTIYFDPGWPRRIFAFPPRGPVPPPFPVRRVVLALGGAYLALQVAIPLRHHLYPGPVAWTEEGHRFSWRMKLRNKEAKVQFRARDPQTGESWAEGLDDLTKEQRRTMAAHPDMILQYAHRIAQYYRTAERREVEVYATAKVSLNSRGPQLLVDPDVDLAKQPRDLKHAAWIRPFDPTTSVVEGATEMEEE